MSNHHRHPYSRSSRPGNASPEWAGRIHVNAPNSTLASSSQPQQASRRSQRPQLPPSNVPMGAYQPVNGRSALISLNSDLPGSSGSSFNDFNRSRPLPSGPFLGYQANLQVVQGPSHTAFYPQSFSNIYTLDSPQEMLPHNEHSSQRPHYNSHSTPQCSPHRGGPVLANCSDHGSLANTNPQLRSHCGCQMTQPLQPQYRFGDTYAEAGDFAHAVQYLGYQVQPTYSIMNEAPPLTQLPEFNHGRTYNMLSITTAESNIDVQPQDSNLHPSSRHYFQNGELRAPKSNITFIGGDQTNNNGWDVNSRAMEILKAHCALTALLNSKERFDIPSCAKETRIAILQTLIAWVERAELSALLGWLRGPAGAGKSTIAQTLAEECKKKGLLAATFFFSRTGSAERADGDRAIPTIILQLILEFPELRPLVMAAINENPIIFDQSRRDQLKDLLVKPFCHHETEIPHEEGQTDTPPFRLTGSARLIIIDGLDECNDPAAQIDLLKIISDATRQLSHPFRFLIVSRPEAHISHTFNNELDLEDEDPLRIDLNDDPDADTDIRHFLKLEFDRMRTQHPNHQLLPSLWPPVGAVDTLVERASKQFIYPAVAVKFVWKNEDLPAQSLQLILDLKLAEQCAERPLACIDELYTFVFSKVLDKHLDSIVHLFSLLSYAEEYQVSDLDKRSEEAIQSPAIFERLLGLSQGQLSIVLKPLLSLLSIPSRPEKNLEFYHASLFDFLKDPNRNTHLKFQPSEGRGWEALALYWIHQLQPEKAERRHHSFCQAATNADLTNKLKLEMMNYDIPYKITEKTSDIWLNVNAFMEMLRKRPDAHHEDFALLRHHTCKIIRVLEAELVQRKIWPSGTIFEMPPAPFGDVASNIHYCLVDTLCRFSILVGWGPCAGLEDSPNRERWLILTFLGRHREFTDYLTLEVINDCAYSLWEPYTRKKDKEKVVWYIARQVAQSRLRELSQSHEPQEIKRVMDRCQMRSLTEV